MKMHNKLVLVVSFLLSASFVKATIDNITHQIMQLHERRNELYEQRIPIGVMWGNVPLFSTQEQQHHYLEIEKELRRLRAEYPREYALAMELGARNR